MNYRTFLAGLALSIAAVAAHAAPVLTLQGVGGVNLNQLTLGQKFQVAVIIEGDTAGEVDAGGTGGGVFTSAGAPFLSFLNIAIGSVAQGIDWSLDPSLFIIDFEAVAAGSGFIATTGQCLNSNLQNYGCGFSSGPLNFTVRDPAALPEPGSLALAGLALLALGALRRRA